MSVVERLMDTIDAETAPDRMSQQQAVETLEQLREELDMRLDALRSEIGSPAR